MTWKVTFTPLKDGSNVGSLVAVRNAGLPDVWEYRTSIDLGGVTDLAPYADKIKAIYAQDVANAAKPAPYANLLVDFAAKLNEV